MITYDREYHFKGRIKINRSRVLESEVIPKDDKVNWLFAKFNESRYSFIYKIITLETANYNEYFEILLSFLMIEDVEPIVVYDKEISLDRGEEHIGTLIIDSKIHNETCVSS